MCPALGGELAQVECAGLAGQSTVSSEDEQLGIMKVGRMVARAAEGAVAPSGNFQESRALEGKTAGDPSDERHLERNRAR